MIDQPKENHQIHAIQFVGALYAHLSSIDVQSEKYSVEYQDVNGKPTLLSAVSHALFEEIEKNNLPLNTIAYRAHIIDLISGNEIPLFHTKVMLKTIIHEQLNFSL